jgi:hypothetical protein
VEIEVAEEVPEGDLEAAEDLRDVELLPEGQFGPADYDYFYGHDGSPI